MRQRADQQLSDALRRDVELHRKAVREAPAEPKGRTPQAASDLRVADISLGQMAAKLVNAMPTLTDAEQAEISARERAARGGSG